MNTKLLTLAALLLVSGAAFATVQEGRREAPGRQQEQSQRERAGQGQGRGHRHGMRRHQRPQGGQLTPQQRDEVRQRVREHLEITDEQRAAAEQARRELAPIRDEVRERARDIAGRVRELRRNGDIDGARQVLREELRPLVQDTKERVKPHVRPLIESLTPEQRQKIERFLERRGAKFNDDRAAGRLGRWLSRRGR
ncbi:MAG: hypothetical protein NTV21_06575 [Planctomycetota bacterium]|nr:hypothetical protein [Planctomycetota bacterium]